MASHARRTIKEDPGVHVVSYVSKLSKVTYASTREEEMKNENRVSMSMYLQRRGDEQDVHYK